jgi:hypothetical protein
MDRGLSAMLIGIGFIASPLLVSRIPFSMSYPVSAVAPMVLYGVFLTLAGFYAESADSYLLLVDFYSILGPILFTVGPVLGYIVGSSFWTTMSYVTAVFVGLPTFLLMKLNTE